MVALPVAIAVGFGLAYLDGAPPIAVDKSAPARRPRPAELGPAACAAIAGLFLFLSGLITGYFDNRAAYTDIGARIGRRPGCEGHVRPRRANRIGSYIQERLGGIMGNFLFGCMLGSTGVIGTILGLLLDIRHIASPRRPTSAMRWSASSSTCRSRPSPGRRSGWPPSVSPTWRSASLLSPCAQPCAPAAIQFEHGGPLFMALWRRLLSSRAVSSCRPVQVSADSVK